jgi:hypothetical protein
VTTSTVTVPLVAALGLGLSSNIPGRNPLLDGFGLIAFASLFPDHVGAGLRPAQRAYLARRRHRPGAQRPPRGLTMHFKLIIALVERTETEAVLEAARAAGRHRLHRHQSGPRRGARSRRPSSASTWRRSAMPAAAGRGAPEPQHPGDHRRDRPSSTRSTGSGIAFQVDVEDAVGISHQIRMSDREGQEEI